MCISYLVLTINDADNQTLQQKYEEALVEMDKLRKRSMIYEKKMNEATVNYKDLLQCTEQMKLDIEQVL